MSRVTAVEELLWNIRFMWLRMFLDITGRAGRASRAALFFEDEVAETLFWFATGSYLWCLIPVEEAKSG